MKLETNAIWASFFTWMFIDGVIRGQEISDENMIGQILNSGLAMACFALAIYALRAFFRGGDK